MECPTAIRSDSAIGDDGVEDAGVGNDEPCTFDSTDDCETEINIFNDSTNGAHAGELNVVTDGEGTFDKEVDTSEEIAKDVLEGKRDGKTDDTKNREDGDDTDIEEVEYPEPADDEDGSVEDTTEEERKGGVDTGTAAGDPDGVITDTGADDESGDSDEKGNDEMSDACAAGKGDGACHGELRFLRLFVTSLLRTGYRIGQERGEVVAIGKFLREDKATDVVG